MGAEVGERVRDAEQRAELLADVPAVAAQRIAHDHAIAQHPHREGPDGVCEAQERACAEAAEDHERVRVKLGRVQVALRLRDDPGAVDEKRVPVLRELLGLEAMARDLLRRPLRAPDDREGPQEGVADRAGEPRALREAARRGVGRRLGMPADQGAGLIALGAQGERDGRAFVAREAIGEDADALRAGEGAGGEEKREGGQVAGGGGDEVLPGGDAQVAAHAIHVEAVDAGPVQLTVREDRRLDGEGLRVAHPAAAAEEVVDGRVVGAAAMAERRVGDDAVIVAGRRGQAQLAEALVEAEAVLRPDRGVAAVNDVPGGAKLTALRPVKRRRGLQERSPELLDLLNRIGARVPVLVPEAEVAPAVHAHDCREDVRVAEAVSQSAGAAH